MTQLEELNSVLNDDDFRPKGKVSTLLNMGLDSFGLGIGLVSTVNGDVYTVKYADSPGDMIKVGTTFSVGETYCCHTLKANKATGFHHAKLSAIASHPCYLHFQLESYIGAPIVVNGSAIGTVNFSAATSRDPFTEDEYTLINRMAEWLGANAKPLNLQ